MRQANIFESYNRFWLGGHIGHSDKFQESHKSIAVALCLSLIACSPKSEDGVDTVRIRIAYETFYIPIPYILHVGDRKNKVLPFVSLMAIAPDLKTIENMDQYIPDKNRTPDMIAFSIGFDRQYREKNIAVSTLKYHEREYGLKLPDFSKLDGLIELGTHGTSIENLNQTIYAYVEDGILINAVTCFSSIKPEKDRCTTTENYLEAHSFKAWFNKKYLGWFYDEGRTNLINSVEKWRTK